MLSPQATSDQYRNWLSNHRQCQLRLSVQKLLAVVLFSVIWLLLAGESTAQAQKRGSFLLKPFQWSNQTNQSEQQAFASDNSQQQESQPQQSYQPTPRSTRFNPFAWSNDGQSSLNQTPRAIQPSIASRIEKNMPIVSGRQPVPNPMRWTNEITPATDARSLQPPPSSSFSEAIQHSLSWQQDPEAKPDPQLQQSMPPENATEKQLVEWEKKKFPWIRPFYMSEPEFGTPEAMALDPIPEFNPSKPGGRVAPLLAKPFQWTNRPNVATATAQSAGQGDARTVAFLQNGEALPLPPQLDGRAESVPPGSESDEQLKVGEDGKEEEGTIGQAETLGREPVDNSLQFLRASTVLLKPGQCQWDYGIAYTLFDRTVPVVVQTSPTTATIELARFRRRELILPLELRYGFTRKIQLFVNAPFGWSNTEFSFGTSDEFNNTGGIGDVIFGGTFLLRQGNHEVSDAIMTLACTAPTGQDPFAPIVGLTPSAPALGGGTWSLASNLLFIKNYDPVVVFYGFGTRQHFKREITGDRTFDAGGEYLYQMGVGFAVNEKITFSTRFNGAYVTESKIDGEKIEGSIQEPMTVGLAMTVSKCKRLIEPFVDFGLTNDATDARFGIVWTR